MLKVRVHLDQWNEMLLLYMFICMCGVCSLEIMCVCSLMKERIQKSGVVSWCHWRTTVSRVVWLWAWSAALIWLPWTPMDILTHLSKCMCSVRLNPPHHDLCQNLSMSVKPLPKKKGCCKNRNSDCGQSHGRFCLCWPELIISCL